MSQQFQNRFANYWPNDNHNQLEAVPEDSCEYRIVTCRMDANLDFQEEEYFVQTRKEISELMVLLWRASDRRSLVSIEVCKRCKVTITHGRQTETASNWEVMVEVHHDAH